MRCELVRPDTRRVVLPQAIVAATKALCKKDRVFCQARTWKGDQLPLLLLVHQFYPERVRKQPGPAVPGLGIQARVWLGLNPEMQCYLMHLLPVIALSIT